MNLAALKTKQSKKKIFPADHARTQTRVSLIVIPVREKKRKKNKVKRSSTAFEIHWQSIPDASKGNQL